MRERKNYAPYCNDPTKLVLHAYGDASFAPTATEKSYDDGVGRSVTGVVVQCCGGTLSWTSKRQSITTASTAESETLAQMTASYHALGLVVVVTTATDGTDAQRQPGEHVHYCLQSTVVEDQTPNY